MLLAEPISVIDSKRRRPECRFAAVLGAAGKRKLMDAVALRNIACGEYGT
jgi:hypothetical protein